MRRPCFGSNFCSCLCKLCLKMFSSACGIFECQAEPLFTVKPNNISSDLLEDWLFILASEDLDKAQLDVKKATPGNFKNGVAVELILRICDQCQQPPEVKYHSIELFDLFMVKHVDDLYKYAQKTYEEDIMRKMWQIILGRVKDQLFLRVLSCVQIVSKLYCHSKAVSVHQLIILLRGAGHCYSPTSITRSELRILETVKYKVSFATPLVYLETLLEALGRNDSELNVKCMYDVSLNVLDVTYLQRNNIFATLFKRITGKVSIDLEQDVPKINLIKEDKLLLATAVISCSAYILNPCSFVHVVEQLHFTTRIPKDEIMDFTTVLVKEILLQDD